MKEIYKFGVLLLCLFLTVSCHDVTTEDIAKVTYYVKMELKGDDPYMIPVGTAYVEPGVIATENGEDVSSKVQIAGTVDQTKVGFYTINYSATNVDGFSKATKRTVIVYNPAITEDISGNYSVNTLLSYRLQASNNAVIKYSDMSGIYGAGDFSEYVVKVEKLLPGIFSVTDFMGGYYAEGRGYGDTYEMNGYVSLTSDNKLEHCSSSSVGWGDSLNALNGGTYNPLTSTIQWSAVWNASAYSFNVVLNKK